MQEHLKRQSLPLHKCKCCHLLTVMPFKQVWLFFFHWTRGWLLKNVKSALMIDGTCSPCNQNTQTKAESMFKCEVADLTLFDNDSEWFSENNLICYYNPVGFHCIRQYLENWISVLKSICATSILHFSVANLSYIK